VQLIANNSQCSGMASAARNMNVKSLVTVRSDYKKRFSMQ